MREFNVYCNSKGSYKAVKNGWCWPAFFFGSFWSLFSGLFLVTIIMLPIEFFLNFFANIISNDLNKMHHQNDLVASIILIVIGIIALIIRLICGYRGNKWRKSMYIRKGFELRGSVKASRKSDAVKYYAV